MKNKISKFLKDFLFNTFETKPFIYFSRMYYGNLSGMKQNFYGRFHLILVRLLGIFNKKKRTDEKIFNYTEKLKNEGFVYITDLDVEKIKKIRESVRSIQQKKPLINGIYKFCSTSDLKNLHPLISEIFSSQMLDLIHAYYNSSFKTSHVMSKHTYNIKNKDSKELISEFWHCDSVPASLLQIFIPLRKVTKNDGPFQVISKHDSKKIVRLGYNRGQKSFNKMIKSSKSFFEFTGEVGSALIVQVGSCLHRATIPKSNCERELMNLHIVPVFGQTKTAEFSQSWIYRLTH